MVVDRCPLHPYQAENLAFTLEEYAKVPRDRIIVQCTDRVAEPVRKELVGNGYTTTIVTPYLDGKYCNKIRQLDYFVNEARSDACGVFLLDLDLVVLSSLEVGERDRVWGKVVDDAVPPLPVLERIYAEGGIAPPPIVPSDWGTGDTLATNLNGGVLYVPLRFLPRVRAAWRKWGEFLFGRPDLFDGTRQRDHIDQIAFGMALCSEGISYRHLCANWNFPVHFPPEYPQSFQPNAVVRVVHYHACIDSFGLIDPAFKGSAEIDEAVRQANAAIGARRESMFLGRYKRHLAEEAIRSVPSLADPLFSNEFVARSRVGGRKRRLILHAGTPKTGTTSLQWHLGSNRRRLAEYGFWYPPSPEQVHVPKHQGLVTHLRAGDAVAFGKYIESALDEMPPDAHSIIFSAEGIFNHWWDYPSQAKGFLRYLAELFDFELCVWFREPCSFAASLYAQVLMNGRTDDKMKNVYGRSILFAEALGDEWFQRHLDYLGFYYETQYLFGNGRVRVFLFEGDTIEAFANHYELGFLGEYRRRENVSPRGPAIRILRLLNEMRLKQSVRTRVVNIVRKIDCIVGKRSETIRLSEEDRALVDRYAGRCWSTLLRNEEVSGASCVPAEPRRDFRAGETEGGTGR